MNDLEQNVKKEIAWANKALSFNQLQMQLI